MKKAKLDGDQFAEDSQTDQTKPPNQPKFIKCEFEENNYQRVRLKEFDADCQYPIVKTVSKSLKWKVQMDSQYVDWDVWWTDNAVQPETLFRMLPHQKINHFPGMYILARKNLLGKGLMKMRKLFPQEYNFFPLTWMLPTEYSQFRLYFESKPKGKSRTYIVKPQALSQGKGISLMRKIEDIPPGERCVVQRYIHKPYLIDGLKFDFRIYVLLAGVDPLRVYLYNQGLARFATQPYVTPTSDNMEDVCMHLTNYAINKDNPKFVFNKTEKDMSVGHKRSLSSVYELLQKQGINVAALKETIKDIIIKTFISGLPLLRHQYRSCQIENYASNMCFQILGFDIMLNDNAQPYLLEVNHTPSFVTDTPLDQFIKRNLIKDSLVLMNINTPAKADSINLKKDQYNRKMLNLRKQKLTPEEKEVLRADAQAKRDAYQNNNLGGFQKIFPVDSPLNKTYQKLSQTSQRLFEESQGIRRRADTQKEKEKERDSCSKLTSITKRISVKRPQPITHVSNLRMVNQDDSVLPYLKVFNRASLEQFVECIGEGSQLGNSVDTAEAELMINNLVREGEGIKMVKPLPTNAQILQFFNNSFLENRFAKEDIEKKRMQQIKNIDFMQRQQVMQQRIEPIRIKFGEDNPKIVNNPEMQTWNSKIWQLSNSMHRRNMSNEKRQPDIPRFVRNRSNVQALIHSRGIKTTGTPTLATSIYNM